MTLTFVLLALIAGQHFADCIKIDPEVDVGGDAGENDFPFMVQLQRYWAVSYLHECGGSLVTPSWVLTAAHCNTNQPKLQVLAGTVRRNDRTNGQQRAVVRFVAHERYVLDGEIGPYDIALALVEEPFLVDGVSVATIELPRVSVWRESDEPMVMAVLGYGKIDESDTMPEVLQTVTVHLRPSADCGKDPVPVGTFCVGSPGSTACQGDSGGPVVGWSADDFTPRLIGVVSFGSRTCGAKPITCTDVAAYMDWINGTLSTAEGMVPAVNS
uniref:Uncharacterized protein n=1 Tax=Anopheles atroparvus TaxID=41427 RepID=A0A182INY7_ANOAO